MTDDKTKQQMLEMLDIMLDESLPYAQRLDAYEFLSEDCEEIVDVMLEKSYALDGDTGKMLMEVLANYKGNKAIFMGLVSYLYKGDDVALFAKLIGSYGDEKGIQVLKTFCDEYEPNYNEFMELRNAVEELGGDFDLKEDFSDDPLYRYLKGLDETDDRKSPFEDIWANEEDECDDEECDDEECDGHHGCEDDLGCHHGHCHCGEEELADEDGEHHCHHSNGEHHCHGANGEHHCHGHHHNGHGHGGHCCHSHCGCHDED